MANNHVYSVTEIVGSSDKGVVEAIQNGVDAASKTLRNLEWFEVTNVRGHLANGKVAHFQVTMKLGLRYDEK